MSTKSKKTQITTPAATSTTTAQPLAGVQANIAIVRGMALTAELTNRLDPVGLFAPK